jgi:hypothetical protein
MGVLTIRKPRARTNASIGRCNSTCCATSTSPASRTASEFDQFRDRYNLERPHDALASPRPPAVIGLVLSSSPKSLPSIEYPAGLGVRKIQSDGRLNYRGHEFRLSSALRGQPVALRPRPDADGQCEVLYIK